MLVLADPRDFRGSIAEVDRILAGVRGRVQDPAQGPPPPDVTVLGGLALDPKGAGLLSGSWGGRLDRSLLIRSAREVAGELAGRLPTPFAGVPQDGRDVPSPPRPTAPQPQQPQPPQPPPAAPGVQAPPHVPAGGGHEEGRR
ncbi:hypothetical protein [Actinomadura madurae]|uniref:hypothetical protein n=1 Tax=Actinomadura madurae TaxID=1993 RepID=UPI0020D24FB5|nr:hypothetical protein [Actinomadura madurae]MCP9979874.1 hypothetical protein [Actinomadura madurae]